MYSDQARRSKQSSTRAQGDDETYEYFTPRTDWARNEDHETLLLFLPGFNKDTLRVQLTDHGVLKISGRQPQSDGKGIRFRKDVPVPSSCDTGNVTAKFENGVLFITLQKKPTLPPKKTTPPLTVTEASWPDHPVPDAPGDSAPTNRGVVSGDSPTAPSGGGKGSQEREDPSYGDGGKESEEPSHGDGGKGLQEREEPSYGDGVKEREKPSHGVLFISLPKKTTPPLPVTKAGWPDQLVPDTPGDSAPSSRGVVSGDSQAAPSGGSKVLREREEPIYGDGIKERELSSHGDDGEGLRERKEPSYGEDVKGLLEREQLSYGNNGKGSWEREEPSYGNDGKGLRERKEPSIDDNGKGSLKREDPSYGNDGKGLWETEELSDGDEECCGFGGVWRFCYAWPPPFGALSARLRQFRIRVQCHAYKTRLQHERTM